MRNPFVISLGVVAAAALIASACGGAVGPMESGLVGSGLGEQLRANVDGGRPLCMLPQVQLCHTPDDGGAPFEECVANTEAPMHLSHGDTQGPCPAPDAGP
jgi:hypothetical protein